MTAVTVGAPFAGWVSGLAEVPDAVFADKMMGDGLAIDPLDGVLRAPCAARVIAVAATAHAVTLELANGAQLLIHVGLDTVALAGDGFVAHVAAGADVAAGTALLGIDLDRVARAARSLVTPIVVANEGFALTVIAVDRLVAAGEPLFEVRPSGIVTAPTVAGDATATREIVVPLANGIHARPAARIAAALKPFAAEVAFAAHGRTANARSTVALLGLGLAHRDPVVVTARGSDAAAAVAAVTALIASGMGEPRVSPVDATPVPGLSGSVLRGVCASRGLAIGTIAQLRTVDLAVPETGGGTARETAALARALHEVADNYGGNDIAVAHRALLDDPELHAAAARGIAAGHSAALAWRTALRDAAATIRATNDPRLIERVADLLDVERQVIAALLGVAPTVPELPDGAVLVADELLPSEFMALDARRLAGIATAQGGPTSHVAILAASAGVPMIVALGSGVLGLANGTCVVLDAEAGTLDTAPSADGLCAAEARIGTRRSLAVAAAATAHELCTTADGIRIEVFANLGSTADAATAVTAGAEGCGLLRTEFVFLDRATAPDEAGQAAVYAAVAAALEGRPLIVRTLDIGGDKPVAYLPLPREDNPALGLRGIRLCLARPDLLAEQFRAVLRGVPAAQCRIMVPMIVDVAELRAVRRVLDAAVAAVGCAPVPLGVMIETPAAALLAASLAAEADFLSVGSNDLTQYTLAADRGNPALAAMIDPLHPAVLRLIASAAAGAAQHGKWLGVCGGVASDPRAAAVLIGLGVTELSATPAAIPAVKAAVRQLRLDDCRALATRALAAETAAAVHALIDEAS